MSQCGKASSNGWLCLAPAGHAGDVHASLDNRRMYRGTPGHPVVWTGSGHAEHVGEYTEEVPVIVTPRIDPPLAIQQGYTGEFCGDCGGSHMRRTGTCSVCDDCGASGGCG